MTNELETFNAIRSLQDQIRALRDGQRGTNTAILKVIAIIKELREGLRSRGLDQSELWNDLAEAEADFLRSLEPPPIPPGDRFKGNL